MPDEMDNMKHTETTIMGEVPLPASPPRSTVGTNYAERVGAYLSGGRLRPLLLLGDGGAELVQVVELRVGQHGDGGFGLAVQQFELAVVALGALRRRHEGIDGFLGRIVVAWRSVATRSAV